MKTWLFALLLALSAPAWAVELVDDLGRRVQLAAAPQRIVVLGPALTEGVCALGACARIVGVDRFSNHPAQVRQLPQLGGLGETSVEQLLALRPDVVLLTPAARLHERLQQLGVPVVALDAQTLPEVRRQLTKLATLLGDPARAERLWAGIEQQLSQARDGLDPRWQGARVYFEVDPTPFAAGEASFIGALLSRMGLLNIVPARLGTFPQLNPEFVIQGAPQLIFASRRAALDQRPGWARVPAVQAQRICSLRPEDGDLVVRPGPRVGEAIAALRACLQTLSPP